MKTLLRIAASAVFLTGRVCLDDGCRDLNKKFPDMGTCTAEIEMLRGKEHRFLALTCGPPAPQERQAGFLRRPSGTAA
jgi:hypothetical protein